MRRSSARRLIIALLMFSGGACSARQPMAMVPQQPSIVFRNVTIVPMTADTVLRNRSVVVQGDRIVTVAPTGREPVPPGARIIEANGRWLIPGLVDAHTHTLGQETHTDRLLLLGLTQGVTTAIILVGDTMPLRLRERDQGQSEPRPTIYVGGPLVDDSLMTFEQGVRLAESYREAGYDLIKVYNHLALAGYRGILFSAERLGMPVVGHVVRSLDLEGVLGAGQQGIVHMEEYLYTYYGLRLSDTTHVAADMLRPETIAHLARITQRAGTFVTPTLVTFERILAVTEDLDEAMTAEGVEYLGRVIQGALRRHGQTAYAERFTHPQQRQNLRDALAFQREMLRSFHEQGVRLLVGTDAPIAVTLPGFGVHRELANFSQAGIPALETLRAATRNAAEYLAQAHEFGTIEPGRRADLILLDADPLVDVGNVSAIAGVMARGRWIDGAELVEIRRRLRESD